MAYKKRCGTIEVNILKVFPDFIDACCTKTGRAITFQLRYKVSDGLRAILEAAITNKASLVIYCKPHQDDGMYWYSKISRGTHHGAIKRTRKQIALSSLMREVEKDFNPIATGSVRQSLVRGRGGLPTSRRTSGKIGASLMKNVNLKGNKKSVSDELLENFIVQSEDN